MPDLDFAGGAVYFLQAFVILTVLSVFAIMASELHRWFTKCPVSYGTLECERGKRHKGSHRLTTSYRIYSWPEDDTHGITLPEGTEWIDLGWMDSGWAEAKERDDGDV